ncbi:metallophosphoesterase [Halobacteriales archaeon QS_1_68_17]|nr:MAG: metallophosphoesterase [Halobacteriales archaeon QS_1_68_17]
MDAAFCDRAAYLDGALVVADLHLGRAAASNVEFPLGERRDLADRLAALLDRFDPDEVVFAGDLLHSFGSVPRTVEETLAEIRGLLREAGARPVVTPGNHDAMLDAVWDGPTAPAYRVGDAVVCHGHERPDADADLFVVGHDHPAITIEGQKRPCYLAGEGVGGGADLLMLPAFTRLAPGATVNGMTAGDFQSPLVADADALRPVVRDEAADETLEFPPLGEFRDLL